jgi:hypothetical protein
MFGLHAMGLIASSQLVRRTYPLLKCGMRCCLFWVMSFFVTMAVPVTGYGQLVLTQPASGDVASVGSIRSHTIRTRRFLGGRTLAGNVSAARAMDVARQQHATMLAQQAASPQQSGLGAAWCQLPISSVTHPHVESATYGRRIAEAWRHMNRKCY